jgi:hypothetical protein
VTFLVYIRLALKLYFQGEYFCVPTSEELLPLNHDPAEAMFICITFDSVNVTVMAWIRLSGIRKMSAVPAREIDIRESQCAAIL